MQEQYKGCYGSDTLFCRIRQLGYICDKFTKQILDRIKFIDKVVDWLNKKLHIGD